MRRWTLLACALWLSGCAQILDIEERKSESSATDPDSGRPLMSSTCEQYCADALRLCLPDQNAQIFETMDNCLGACAHYSVEDKLAANTLACRAQLLKDATQFGEAATACQGASPGGGSPPVEVGSHCGSNCEGYCALYAGVCRAESDCLRKCQALPDTGSYSAKADFMSGVDSLQCRLAHLSTAAGQQRANNEMGRMTHCGHSGLRPTSPCELGNDKNPKCADYCKLVTNACTNDLKVYDDEAQCLKTCESLQAKNPGAEKRANTVRCRREFTYDALLVSAERFCSDSGPAPSQCGDRCESYCQIAQTACPAQFSAQFPTGIDKCKTDCRLIPANASYAIGKANRDTIDCRIKNATRALTDPRACDSALPMGSAECRN